MVNIELVNVIYDDTLFIANPYIKTRVKLYIGIFYLLINHVIIIRRFIENLNEMFIKGEIVYLMENQNKIYI